MSRVSMILLHQFECCFQIWKGQSEKRKKRKGVRWRDEEKKKGTAYMMEVFVLLLFHIICDLQNIDCALPW